jgi:PAS domain S-box-containing protein
MIVFDQPRILLEDKMTLGTENILKGSIKVDKTAQSHAVKMQRNQIEEKIQRVNRKDWERTVDAIDDWIALIDLDLTIRRSNRTVEKYFQIRVQDSIGMKCSKLLYDMDIPIDECPMSLMLKTKKRESAEIEIKDGRWMLITVDPIFDDNGEIINAVYIARDITDRVLIQKERQILVKDLKKALIQINTLGGLIPICSHCKKIRDDKGYWNLIESYIERHSDAKFSHGMCPECSDQLYGDQDWYINMKRRKKNR